MSCLIASRKRNHAKKRMLIKMLKKNINLKEMLKRTSA